MSEPTRIRAQLQGGKTAVRMLMSHPMESGQRKDADGRTLAPWYIQEVAVTLNGAVVLRAQWGPAVSKDPYLQLTLTQAKLGDRVAVSWTDNHGEQRTDETTVVNAE